MAINRNEQWALLMADHGQAFDVDGATVNGVMFERGGRPEFGTGLEQNVHQAEALLAKDDVTLSRDRAGYWGTLTDADGGIWAITAILGQEAEWYHVTMTKRDVRQLGTVRTG